VRRRHGTLRKAGWRFDRPIVDGTNEGKIYGVPSSLVTSLSRSPLAMYG
jgi:hypothetical protein